MCRETQGIKGESKSKEVKTKEWIESLETELLGARSQPDRKPTEPGAIVLTHSRFPVPPSLESLETSNLRGSKFWDTKHIIAEGPMGL